MAITARTVSGAESRTDRLIAKLADPRASFSSAQLAYMMGVAAQWARDALEGEPAPITYRGGFAAGYQARVAEENADYPPEPFQVYSGGGWIDRVDRRRRADAEARAPREGDFLGLGDEAVAALRVSNGERSQTGGW